jgi:Flp pilus assembly protein TadG
MGEPVSRLIMKMRLRVRKRLKLAARRRARQEPKPVRRSVWRSKSGSAAIEFAFVAPVFFLFLMGTMEVGLIFLGNFVLANATTDAARQIRTGQVALNAINQTQFRTMICNEITPLLACDAKLQVDVETFANFSATSVTNPLDANGNLQTSLNNWAPGSVCSIVMVRSFYTWPVATPLLTPFLVNMANNQFLMTAAAAFRNEPYDTSVSGC